MNCNRCLRWSTDGMCPSCMNECRDCICDSPSGLYRVRHPAAPELFVWMAGTFDPETKAYTKPLERKEYALGSFAKLTVTFSSTQSGIPKDDAERLAKFVGGYVEGVPKLTM